MWIKVYIGALTFTILKAKGSNFTIKTNLTNWENAPCKLALPRLKYSIDKNWTVDEPRLEIPQNGLWIGYVIGQVAFDYLGCSSNCTENTTDVKSIGDCHWMCNGNAFGIQKADSTGTVRCCCGQYMDCLLSESCNDQCGDDEMFLCGKRDSHYNSFSIYGITNVSALNDNAENFACLDFNYPNFKWTQCKGPSKKLLCSYFKDGKRLAVVQEQVQYHDSWAKANQNCFDNQKYPATVDSIQTSITNRTFGTSDTQGHWTGVIRTHAMLNAENKDLITSSTIKYAVINNDNSISYEVMGSRSSLCDESFDTSASIPERFSPNGSQITCSESSVNPISSSITDSFTKAYVTAMSPSTQHSTDSLGLGIGVAVGLLCAVGAVVVIIVLRKRGVLTCRLGSNNDTNTSRQLDCASKSNESYEDEIKNRNYFILDKCAQSAGEGEDHTNTADEPSEGNAEPDNYTSINEAEEPYQSIKDEYDYTTNALRTGSKSTNPDNIYNKLKLDLPGDYAHVGRLGNNISKASSDYDTTAVARRNDGVGDYNHIPHPDRTTCARRNGSKDDYDVINGKKAKFPPSDSAEYAHVKS